jgi:hypothetical protein
MAFTCACLAICGWVLQRTAFSPSNTEDSAKIVLDDSALEAALIDAIADAAAPQLPPFPGAPDRPPTPDEVAQYIEANVLNTSAGAELVAGILRDAHAKLIGDSEENPVITSAQMVQITRYEAAAAVPPVELPVPRVGSLAVAKDVTSWLVPVMALATVVFLVLCFLAHPEKAVLVRTLGLGLLVLAALILVFGYVVPKLVPTLLTDSVWARIPPRLADQALPITIGAVLLLTGGGLALFVASSRMGRGRRWSTPISTYRYREERSWS